MESRLRSIMTTKQSGHEKGGQRVHSLFLCDISCTTLSECVQPPLGIEVSVQMIIINDQGNSRLESLGNIEVNLTFSKPKMTINSTNLSASRSSTSSSLFRSMTALTRNTLSSAPVFLHENALPAYLDIESLLRV